MQGAVAGALAPDPYKAIMALLFVKSTLSANVLRLRE